MKNGKKITNNRELGKSETGTGIRVGVEDI